MSRSGLMTLDPVVSLRSGRAADARTGIRGSHADPPNSTTWLSLLKTVNYRESLRIFPCDRRTVGRHDHHSICFRFHALVPVSQPSVAGTRACRLATSTDRLAAAKPSPPPASFRRPAPMGVPLPSVAEGPRRLGTRQTGDGGEMASQGLSDLLAVAITLSGPVQSFEQGQRRSAVGPLQKEVVSYNTLISGRWMRFSRSPIGVLDRAGETMPCCYFYTTRALELTRQRGCVWPISRSEDRQRCAYWVRATRSGLVHSGHRPWPPSSRSCWACDRRIRSFAVVGTNAVWDIQLG
jgi:hypothetical protein